MTLRFLATGAALLALAAITPAAAQPRVTRRSAKKPTSRTLGSRQTTPPPSAASRPNSDGTIGPEEAPHISIRILGEATPDRSPRPARTGGTPKAAIRLTIAPGALRPETLPAPARPPSDAPGRAPGGLD